VAGKTDSEETEPSSNGLRRLWKSLAGYETSISPVLTACQVIVDEPHALGPARFGEGPLSELTRDEMRVVERSLQVVLGMH
jgi:hypothetical protein